MESEYSEKTRQMPRLILDFAWCKSHTARFLRMRLIFDLQCHWAASWKKQNVRDFLHLPGCTATEDSWRLEKRLFICEAKNKDCAADLCLCFLQMQNIGFLMTRLNLLMKAKRIWDATWENRSSGIPTRSDTNRAGQLLKMARDLKFRI